MEHYEYLLCNDLAGFASKLLKDKYCTQYLSSQLQKAGKHKLRARKFLKSPFFTTEVARNVLENLEKIHSDLWSGLDYDYETRLETDQIIYALGFVEGLCLGKAEVGAVYQDTNIYIQELLEDNNCLYSLIQALWNRGWDSLKIRLFLMSPLFNREVKKRIIRKLKNMFVL